MSSQTLVAFSLILFSVGCTSLREAELPVSAPDPPIPAADVSVEVDELPGLFQVTEQR
jgi:hypothetical protein